MNERIVRHGIAKIMLAYWIMVILWQTFRPVANRSIVDSLVKVSLFGVVLLHAIYNRDTRNSEPVVGAFMVFLLTQFITVISDSLSVGALITVGFMSALIITFLIMQRNEEISGDSLEWLAKLIILTGVIMGLYSILFKTARFVRSFTKVGIYGSECKSFLYSNHEYALYLATAIILAVWLQYRKRGNGYLFALLVGFLTVNLISTFSRTAIIGCAAGVIILSFFMGSRTRGYIALAIAAAVCVLALSSDLRAFFLQKVLKNAIADSGSVLDKGRASMYNDEWLYFLNGNFIEKLFGHGYNGNTTGGHDAYLMILNTGGIAMFLFFVSVIVWSLAKALICFRIQRETGSLCFALQTLVLLYMVAQTPILFYSSMDSFFITMLFVLIPLYTSNHLLRCAAAGKAASV